MTEDEKSIIMSRISWTDKISDLTDVDFVVEAVNEDFSLKQKIFTELAEHTPSHAILASNTSSISITKIGGVIPDRAHQVIGMHFMNPVPVMKLVEMIKALQTDEATINTTVQLAEEMGKTTSKSEDVPGFIANRILMPYINEAV
jgi:3-hydroxybutyryl-CoA dehydrogenase